MTTLPTDDPLPVAPPLTSLADTPPLITPEQRNADFNRVFHWHGREIALTIASELFYRDFRVRCGAPPLADYETAGDYIPEACRILYCAHLDAAACRQLRMLSPEDQMRHHDDWVAANIQRHEFTAAVTLAMDINATLHRARTQPAEGSDVDGVGN